MVSQHADSKGWLAEPRAECVAGSRDSGSNACEMCVLRYHSVGLQYHNAINLRVHDQCSYFKACKCACEMVCWILVLHLT